MFKRERLAVSLSSPKVFSRQRLGANSLTQDSNVHHPNQRNVLKQKPFSSITNNSNNSKQQINNFKQQFKKAYNKVVKTNTTQKQNVNHISSPQDNQKITTTAADRATRFGATSKTAHYDNLKNERIQERKDAIMYGQIPDPSNPTRLEDAVDFRGTCSTKCPEFEMVEREIQNNIDFLECDSHGNPDPTKTVKAYRRSAAGNDQPLPSDVRTPEALMSTLDYLINTIVRLRPLHNCHAFVRDRTRSIRQDFTLQNIRDVTAVQAHEKIARFHILCLHDLTGYDEKQFSEQQETEQLRKVLISLMEFYDDLREEGIETENEAEFRAYHLISHFKDQDVARQLMTLPVHIFRHPYITRALEFYGLCQRNSEIMETSSRRNKPQNIEASQNFYSQFFKLVRDINTPFLMACMLESHFYDIRKGAFKAMNVSYMMKAGGVKVNDIYETLGYESYEHCMRDVNLFGIPMDMSLGEPTICFGQRHYRTKIPIFIEPLSKPKQTQSLLVDNKKSDRKRNEIINGENEIRFVDSQRLSQASWNTPDISMENAHDLSEEQKKKQLELQLLKSRAAAASAVAFRERKKMEDLMAKKAELVKQQETKRLKAEQDKLAELQRLKEQQRLTEQQKLMEQQRLIEEQRLIEQQKFMEQQRLTEEDRLIEQQRRLHVERMRIFREEKALQIEEERVRKIKQEEEERRRKMAEKRLFETLCRVSRKEASRHLVDELMKKVVKEKIVERVCKSRKIRKFIKKKTSPWLLRARKTIDDRNKRAREENKTWHFEQCINGGMSKYYPLHSTEEGIKTRVDQCYKADQTAYSAEVNQHDIWKPVNFSDSIYPTVKDKLTTDSERQTNDKPTWQLLIHTDDNEINSNLWFKKKFNLDNTFNRKIDRLQECNITTRIVNSKSPLPSKLVNEVGAVIFSLPETDGQTPQEIDNYWQKQKQRFDQFIQNLRYYKPGVHVPILFTYFPGTTQDNIEMIPVHLGLSSKMSVRDYHILRMSPNTITTRIEQEVSWLAQI